MELEATTLQDPLESSKELRDIVMGRAMAQDFVDEPLERAVIDDGQHTKGAIVQFIYGDVTREVREGTVKVVRPDMLDGPFFPPPLPSSEW